MASLVGGSALAAVADSHTAPQGKRPVTGLVPETFDALGRLNSDLARIDKRTAVLIVIDQWEAVSDLAADRVAGLKTTLAELVRHLAELPTSHIMLCLVVQDGMVARSIPRLSCTMDNIDVSPLPDAAVADLVRSPNYLGQAYGPYFDELSAARIAEKCRGNVSLALSLAKRAVRVQMATQTGAWRAIDHVAYDNAVLSGARELVREDYGRFIAGDEQRLRSRFVAALLSDGVDSERIVADEVAAASGGDFTAEQADVLLSEMARETSVLMGVGGGYAFLHSTFRRVMRDVFNEFGGYSLQEASLISRLRAQLTVAAETVDHDAWRSAELMAEVTCTDARGEEFDVLRTRAHQTLLQWLAHSSPATTEAVAAVCGRYRIAEAVPLLGRLVAVPRERVAQAAVRALGRYATPDAGDILRECLLSAASGVRAEALSVAAEADLPGIAKRAAELLGDPDWRVKHSAARSLGLVGLQRHATLLDQIADPTYDLGIPSDLAEDVKAAAVSAANMIRSRALPELRRC